MRRRGASRLNRPPHHWLSIECGLSEVVPLKIEKPTSDSPDTTRCGEGGPSHGPSPSPSPSRSSVTQRFTASGTVLSDERLFRSRIQGEGSLEVAAHDARRDQRRGDVGDLLGYESAPLDFRLRGLRRSDRRATRRRVDGDRSGRLLREYHSSSHERSTSSHFLGVMDSRRPRVPSGRSGPGSRGGPRRWSPVQVERELEAVEGRKYAE